MIRLLLVNTTQILMIHLLPSKRNKNKMRKMSSKDRLKLRLHTMPFLNQREKRLKEKKKDISPR